MKISRFSSFINESTHTKDIETFEDIFIDLIHLGFKISEFDKGYFSSLEGGYSEHPDTERKKPGYRIKLWKYSKKDSISVDFDLAKNVMEILEECNSRISDYGEYILDDIHFRTNGIGIEYRLLDKESSEVEVNTTIGFDSFVSTIKHKWSNSYNKLTRSFEFSVTKEGVKLTPKENIEAKPLLTIAKKFIRDSVTRKYYMGGGPNWRYTYDIDLKDNSIFITFNNRVDETPAHARTYTLDEYGNQIRD